MHLQHSAPLRCRLTPQSSEKARCVGSRSFKVIEFGSNRTGIYIRLPISNYIATSAISYTLSHLRRRNGWKSPFGHIPVSFNAIARGDSLRTCW